MIEQMLKDLAAAKTKAGDLLDAQARSFLGFPIILDPKMGPNEFRFVVGREVYDRIKRVAGDIPSPGQPGGSV